jgi:2-polyprenyl-6-methoxyphenol hydroxylase-like FAD-dependent oxidoreductase
VRSLSNVLIVGGGIGGMSAAIAFRQRGVAVDLIDIDPDWRVAGAGLTITGPTLRAFHRLGLLDAVGLEGFFSDQVQFFDGDGNFLHAMDSPVLEAGIPAAGGILRPALHRILSQRTVADGVDVRLGTTVEDFAEDHGGVVVGCTDGTTRKYDAVVGADGSHSALRARLFPDAPPLRFTGQGCWRMLAPRPDSVTCAQIYFGPDNVKVGVNPCSDDSLYLFATVAMPGNPHIAEDQLVAGMRDILAPFGGRIGAIRREMNEASSVNYRPLFAMMLPAPWHKGRIGLIGDAVHPTTPHLASGAGISVEDGLVLALEMQAADSVEAGWTAFTARREARASMVVRNSLRISELEQAGNGEAAVKALMSSSNYALAQPM